MSDPNSPHVPRVPDVPDVPHVPDVPQVPDIPDTDPRNRGVDEGGAPPAAVPPPPAAPVFGDPTSQPNGAGLPAYAGPTSGPAGASAGASYAAAPSTAQPVLSIISLVAGILGLIGFPIVGFIPIVGGILGLFVPAAAIVLGFLGKQKEPQAKGFWMTGLITGFVGVFLSVASIVIWSVVLASIPITTF